MNTVKPSTLAAVRRAALSSFLPEQLRTTRISMESQVRRAGDTVGPSHRRHTLQRDGILVFVDPFPRANFGHDCRYVFYDPARPTLITESFAARFPPESAYVANGLTVINEPRRGFSTTEALPRVHPPVSCTRTVGNNDNRFALLWSGMTSEFHLNDLEFCYRMLTQCYRFKPENVLVANFDRSFNTVEWRKHPPEKPILWPGDRTPYLLSQQGAIDFPGTRDGMVGAIARLRARFPSRQLPAGSLLFLYTSSHGDGVSSPFLCKFPDNESYLVQHLLTDIQPLVPHTLLVTMTQCCSGGFAQPFVEAKIAPHLFFGAACGVDDMSTGTEDGRFGSFAFHWIGAQRGFDPHNDTDIDLVTRTKGVVTAAESFDYASERVANKDDKPLFRSDGEAADAISLG